MDGDPEGEVPHRGFQARGETVKNPIAGRRKQE